MLLLGALGSASFDATGGTITTYSSGGIDYKGSDVALLVNGLGGSPAEELYVVYRRVKQICDANKINIKFKHVGNQVTALEMQGTSVSLLRLDSEMHDLIKNTTIDTCMYKKV